MRVFTRIIRNKNTLFGNAEFSLLVLDFNFLLFVQITRRDETIQQLEGDLDTSRKQLKDAIEEVNRTF